MRKLLTRVALLVGATAGVASATVTVAHHVVAASQKALVYCPVGVDVAGCNTIVATLAASPAFAGGVDRAYDGSSGTVDLATVDLAQYAVLVIPSLAADAAHEPYAVLRSAAVQQRLRAGLTGRIAMWGGTPDLGSASRAEKDQLLRNLASWGAKDWAVAGSTGLVALADLSADAARRYDWLAGVSRVRVTTDAELYGFDAVTPLTGTAKEILKKADGTTPLAYANMASFGLSVAEGSVGTKDAQASAATDAGTVTRTVLVTAPGGVNTGAATIRTDKDDYLPGMTVTFTGTGWTPGETVSISLHENPTEHEDRTFSAVADSAGDVRNTDLVLEAHHLGVTFYVTAKGGTSGSVAQTSFTDGNSTVTGTVTSSAPGNPAIAGATVTCTSGCNGSPPPSTTTAANGSYTLPVQFPGGSNGTFTLTASAPGFNSVQNSISVTNNANATSNFQLAPTARATTTGVASSKNPSVFGETVTFTATVNATGGTAAPTGVVQFRVDGTNQGGAVSLTPGGGTSSTATLSLSTLTAGTHAITAFYSPTGAFTASDNGAAPLTQTVGKATPAITWANPADVTYGTALGTTQLNATASVPGTFGYTPAAGTVLPFGSGQSLSVTFTPSDATNYTSATATVAINVKKAALTITASSPANVPYGAAAPTVTPSFSGFVNGDDATKLTTQPTCGTTYAAGQPVGTYATTCAGAASASYDIAYVAGSFKVEKGTITVTPANASRAYGQANPTLTGTVTGALPADNISATYATTATAASPVGSYDVTAALVDPDSKAGNYTVVLNKGTLTVGKATLTVKADNAAREYGDPNPTFTGTLTGVAAGDAITASFIAGSGGTVGPTSPIGDYAIVPTLSDPDNKLGNYDVISANGTITISKASLTVTPANASRKYGESNPPFGGTVSGIKNLDPITASYATTATAASAVGSYDITVTLDDPSSKLGNYDVTLNKGTLTVTKAALTVKADDRSRVYGDANPPFTGQLTGLVNGDGITASFTTAATAASPVGNFPITATLADPTGRLANYDVTNTDGTLTVTRASLTIEAANATKVYGAALPAFGGTITGVRNDDAISATYVSNATNSSGVGSYPIVPTPSDPDHKLGNYDVALTNGTLTVTPAPLTVTANEQMRVYGAANPTFTASIGGFVLGETETALGGTLAFTGDGPSAVARTDVGSYTITPGGLTSTNYAIAFKPGKLTITQAPLTVKADDESRTYGDGNPTLTGQLTGVVSGDEITASYATAATPASVVGSYPIVPTLADPGHRLGNYAVTATNGTLKVEQAPLTITAANATKVYGDAVPALTGTISGIRNGDGIAATYSTAATNSSDVGSYDIVPAAVDATPSKLGNYAVTLTKAALSVTPKALTAKADDKTKVYGAALPAFTASYDGFVLGQTPSVLGGALAFATSATAASHVGTYTITPSGLTSGNYAITFADGTLEVTKAAITIKADDKTRVYGGDNPTFTAIYNGFVLGETEAVLTTPVTFGGTATTASVNTDVGEYPVTPGGATSGDYEISFVNGKLTITKASLTVGANSRTRVYGDPNPALDGTIGGVVGTDVITATYSTTADPASPVGDYPIVPALVDGGGRLGNYDLTSANGTLTVTRAPLTITADAKSRVYGAANPAFTGTIVGIRNGDGIGASYSTAATPASNVGSYDIVPAAVDVTPARLGNYTVTLVNGKLTITPATPTVVWPTPAPVPQGTVLSGTQLNATISGVDGATVQGTFAYAPPAGTPVSIVGSQALTTTFTSQNVNYANATGSVSLAVTNVAPVVTSIALIDKPISVNTPTSITAQFTDPGLNDTHTATITWDDGQNSDGVVSNRTVSGSHSYASAGVYTVTVTVKDNNGGTGSRASTQDVIGYIVVYDPSAGFVTGGGWINSPVGACKLPSCTDGTVGKANFGFNAKYKKGANVPDGNTEFQFQAGGLNFKSTDYSWLVVAGSKAQYKGTGTINGQGGYNFLLTAIDGDLKPKGSPDSFRIRIWNAGGTVYDNQMGSSDDSDAATTLGGGSIVIHQ